jgi:hypothetical protein
VGWHVDSQDCVDLGGHVVRALAEVEGAADAETLATAAGAVARFVDRYPHWRDLLDVPVLEQRQLRDQEQPRARGANGEPSGAVAWYAQPGRAWPLLGQRLTAG